MKVVVSAPSRLHFGLLRFEQVEGPSFGGLGLMLDEPRTVVELAVADKWQAAGPDVDRALQCARQAWAAVDESQRPCALSVTVKQAAPAHQGLGSGTQLALAVAVAVRQLSGLPSASAAELAAVAGRGRRSAIGCHGFVHGGLLYETGRPPGESLGALACRTALPAAWRIVLVSATAEAGLNGRRELNAFRRLSAIPASTTERLDQLARDQIIPAVHRADFVPFCEAMHEYGRLAGECFAAVQGGAYASPAIAACVETLRRLGARGTGQSSWGPTVFAFAESAAEAERLAESLRGDHRWRDREIRIVAADNRGATTTRS